MGQRGFQWMEGGVCSRAVDLPFSPWFVWFLDESHPFCSYTKPRWEIRDWNGNLGHAGMAHPSTKCVLEPKFPAPSGQSVLSSVSRNMQRPGYLLHPFFPDHFFRLNLGLNHQIPESCGGSTQNKVMKRGGRDEPWNVLASEPGELLVGRAHGYIWALYSQ